MLNDYQYRDEYDPPFMPTTYYYCHTCKDWQPTEPHEYEFSCVKCGEIIQCDECGQPWTNTHTCKRNHDAE